MHILVTGASGFLGSQIVTDLLQAGHQVRCCVRNSAYAKQLFPNATIVDCDFQIKTHKDDWLPLLDDIDVVINTVGIFYHPQKKIIWQTHYEAPRALFDACVDKKIKKIIHISALGVDKSDVDYARSKKAADDYLMKLPISAVILRPSLIYGKGSYGGTSLFRGLAGLPGLVLFPGDGKQEFQPIYINDLSAAVLKLMDVPVEKPEILSAVSLHRINLKNVLTSLRTWLGFPKAFALGVPLLFIRMGSFFGNLLPNSTMNTTAYKMLEQNNVTTEAESEKFINKIGFVPKDYVTGLFSQPSTVQDRWHARLFFVKPLLQFSLAFLWLFSGITSVFFYLQAASFGLLESVGISAVWQPFFLYSASLLDILIGLALLFNVQIKKICVLQIILILIYTIIISIKLPYLWLEPFGPITKNIPLLVAVYILYVLGSNR